MNEHLSCVEVSAERKVGILKFSRARKHNAFNQKLMEEASTALRTFNRDNQINAIVVTGAGPSFSAGFDLNEVAAQKYTTPCEWQAAVTADFE